MARKRQLEGYTYQQEKGFEVAKEVAQNDAIAQFSNIGVGLGMITGVGGEIGKTVGGVASQAMQSVTAQTVQTEVTQMQKRFCMNCGHELSAMAKFCEGCGTKVQGDDSCSNCGFKYTNEARFCPMCGTKRG